jgi:carboxypeptidase C (cathepsin A)
LKGGPGSDSLIGLFQELGPCRINEELESILNPYSWNNVSNMLFLSQPVGVAFSYAEIQNGSYANYSGTYLNSSYQAPTGTWPILDPINAGEIDTTDLAAVGTWHTLQAFLEGLPSLEGNRASKPKNFNLWTESYGGHYGPSFFSHFQEQNEKISNGSMPGYLLNFNTLGIINGIIDESIQVGYYPEFAKNNTYGIELYNDTVYNYAKFANNMINGCLEQIQSCIAAAADVQNEYTGKVTLNATSNPSLASICSEAQNMCRDNVEGLYYAYGDRGTYDIRHPSDDPTPPSCKSINR